MRVLSTALVLALLAGLIGCGDDDGASTPDASTPTPTPPTPVPPAPIDGAVPTPPPTSPPPSDGGTPPPPPAGSRIERLIRGDLDTRLVIEVDVVPGFGPRDGIVDRATESVITLLDKPDGFETVMDGTVESRGADHAWTVEELHESANATFDLSVPEGTITLHVLFVDGRYANESPGALTLGVALDDTHVVMFKERLTRSCEGGGAGPLLTDDLCDLAETSVLVHEMGHAIGLVNNGLPMVTPHEDADHRAHDTNRDCVMYWAYEGGDVIGTLLPRLLGGSNEPLPFDDACRADIAAIRDR